ncbi:hypothetical protein NPIL_651321 [Nephila pilipes]|uniref:PiggyBac transposable element-derived protein domain-containing protein n=1 Tax=Nephila pilipes TaxID=299642 RepID=A0A8X6R1J3_NEPPI|nr:hypothetical protein NPIL_651321 [Nephila pilipes]
MRQRRGLTDAQIAKLMQDCIPSDKESEVENEFSDDSDYSVHTTVRGISSSESDNYSDSNDTILYNMQVAHQVSSDRSGSSNSHLQKIVWRKEPNNLLLQSFSHPCEDADFVKDLYNPKAIDLFSAFFIEKVLENIVFQTNLHAEQLHQTKPKQWQII